MAGFEAGDASQKSLNFTVKKGQYRKTNLPASPRKDV